MANAANITRRSIFKLAPAAVLASGGAVIAFPAKSEPLTLDQEIDQTVERLEALLAEKYPAAIPVKGFYDGSVKETREGGYLICIMGNPPKISWSGEGYYEIFVRSLDTEPTLLWVEECWDHLRDCTGYRGYGREAGQRKSAYVYFPAQSLHIHRKISI